VDLEKRFFFWTFSKLESSHYGGVCTYRTDAVCFQKVQNSCCRLVPEKYFAAVTSTDHVLTAGTVKVNALDRLVIAMTLVLLNWNAAGLFVSAIFEEKDVMVVVAGQNFCNKYDDSCWKKTKKFSKNVFLWRFFSIFFDVFGQTLAREELCPHLITCLVF
jgi:hypothetical protein